MRGSPKATRNVAFKHQNDTIAGLALKHGAMTVRILRDFYGSFAPHYADELKLSDILTDLDVASLAQLIRDYKSGRLEQIKRTAATHPEQ
jgi:hypothetical protein